MFVVFNFETTNLWIWSSFHPDLIASCCPIWWTGCMTWWTKTTRIGITPGIHLTNIQPRRRLTVSLLKTNFDKIVFPQVWPPDAHPSVCESCRHPVHAFWSEVVEGHDSRQTWAGKWCLFPSNFRCNVKLFISDLMFPNNRFNHLPFLSIFLWIDFRLKNFFCFSHNWQMSLKDLPTWETLVWRPARFRSWCRTSWRPTRPSSSTSTGTLRRDHPSIPSSPFRVWRRSRLSRKNRWPRDSSSPSASPTKDNECCDFRVSQEAWM